MQINEETNDTYSENLVQELSYQATSKKMRNLAIAVFLLDILLIVAMFISFDAFPYAVFISTEVFFTLVIAIICIKTNRVSEKAYRVQRVIVFVYTIIESVVVLSLCIFSLATTTKTGTIVGIIFEMMVPGIIVMLLKLWFIFIKKTIQEK